MTGVQFELIAIFPALMIVAAWIMLPMFYSPAKGRHRRVKGYRSWA
jgi:hypothetical protein